jgi:hypothetical protein
LGRRVEGMIPARAIVVRLVAEGVGVNGTVGQAAGDAEKGPPPAT